MATVVGDTCDSLFGPVVSQYSCRGGFDFTVLFEAWIFNITPAACFLLLFPIRLFQLSRETLKVKTSSIHLLTLAIATAVAGIQVVLLVFNATQHYPAKYVSLAGATLSLVVAVSIVVLLHLEHSRAVRPSFLASAYLFMTVLLDTARVRTAWLLPHGIAYPACLTASLVTKLFLLVLANVEKRKWLLPAENNQSIESTSGLFSRGLFAWLNELLRKGHTLLLTSDTLPNIHEKLSSSDLSDRFSKSWALCDQSRQHALLLAIFSCLRWDIAAIALPRLALIGFNIAQPFLVGKTVAFLEQTESSLNIGYGLIGAIAIIFIGIAITTASYEHLGFRATTMVRGGLMALVYQHMMELPLGSTDESSAMSLMGADVEMLAEYFHSTVCESWACIIQLGLAAWILQTQIGIACITPIIIVVAFTAASFAMGNAVSARQKTWLQATEKRINFTSHVLGSIKNVKFLGLTEIIKGSIGGLRIEELEISKKFRRIQTVRICMINLPRIIAQFATFATYAVVAKVQGSDGLSVSQATTALSLINLLISPLTHLLLAVPDTFASIGCLYRVQDFLRCPNIVGKYSETCPIEQDIQRINLVYTERRELLQPEADTSHVLPTSLSEFGLGTKGISSENQSDVLISLKNARFGWNSSPSAIAGITLDLSPSPSGILVAIVGPVGSGKSTFLKGLANETSVLDGEAFIKYTDLAFCEQTPWLTNTTIRENIVGENSSVAFDANWYSTVVSACALDSDLKKMPAGDETSVGSKGSKLSGGQKQRIAIARAIYARKRIACFDDTLSALDNATARLVFNNVFGPSGLLRRLGCTVFLTTHNVVQYLPQTDFIVVLGENGNILEQGSFSQLVNNAGGYIDRLGIQLGQIEKEEMQNDSTVGLPETHEIMASRISTSDSTDERRQTSDISVYKYYFSAMGWVRVSVLAFFLVVNGGIGGLRNAWIGMWSSSADSASNSGLGYWLGMYGALSFIEAASMVLAVYWTWVVIVPAASKNVHAAVLQTCMSAPLSFLSHVDTGSLITRFSQDMRLVDMILPRGFITTGFQLVGALSQAAIAIAALPYLAVALPFLVGMLVLVQRFYLRTSRQLRLLEIELKSPLYTHFIESLAGIVTIRAFLWTTASTSKMLYLLDRSQRPFYLLLCIQQWLGLVLKLMVTGMTVILVGVAVPLRGQVSPGLLGIALIGMMDLGAVLSDLIQNWTLLETSLGAISRIKEFSEDTPSEEIYAAYEQLPDTQWPSSGDISFVSADIAYESENAGPVLHSIHLDIRAGEKVGLCGRTGSGKSTLALSLLRLNEVVSGQILIDGIDISTIPRSFIRHRISSLSQEAFLFPGTIRQNIDPLGLSTDIDIIEALKCVEIWNALVSATNSGANSGVVLDAILTDTTLSEGQKQLFCLGRALLKKSNILILDEPTSSLDVETDAKVQKVIRQEFQNCTIIMVAHRVHTMLDFDRVVVLDSGRIIEGGHPSELLADKEGVFSTLHHLEQSTGSKQEL
ncbi:ABC transporter integral membrane type 1 [Penicillium cf. griseofulvum]|uniref:ABC transporter integral membrane type 1 n=1 Tax=Penicillium cf. griseofulvum TaxID=2972120 RepID=A0A9W9MET5_9EURO|nr:ABC transporter integral membrane type 1 [Penicillium cf. griseofulvum]KAJ5423462.1 ABC transporter integral membrane type 1 [Penicillium cf. griseofulvum]